MNEEEREIDAEVIGVYPNKIKICINQLDKYKTVDEQVEKLKVGSYLKVADDENNKLITMIESFSILLDEKADNGRKYIIDANPLGIIKEGKFFRGNDSLTIPPTKVYIASDDEISTIFKASVSEEEAFCFASLSQNSSIKVPINGNKFFNKHFAIVGSTGSGKSNTVAKTLQQAIESKNSEYTGLNNSHIIIFDIHGEYKSAFENANYIDINNLILPYWLLNSMELEELFIDTEANDHNQRNVFKEAIVQSKKDKYSGSNKDKIHYDSPLLFDIKYVLSSAKEKNEEMIPGARAGTETKGSLNGKLTNFINRLESKINDKRLEFLLGNKTMTITFEDTIKQFIGYKKNDQDINSNVTIIDLSGIPFEALSISVSLISRIMFEYGYYYKRKLEIERKSCETPVLLVYEEAHKYVPRSYLVKYRSVCESIERIAKEGRKYGVTLCIVSQRPSEISETIFSQCNSFLVMRLTNPDDQNYVKKLLPDSMSGLTDTLSTLSTGQALIVGDAIVIPSIVNVDRCDENHSPSSNDIPYLEIWKEEWKDVNFSDITTTWKNVE